LELRHLRYFLAIAETSSFTVAATLLRISQPTLSHQIKQLEEEIGAPLFDRLSRSVQLTAPGRIFRAHAQRALKELEAGLATVTDLQGLMQGPLRMGVFRSFGNSLLPKVLAEFHRHYPRIRISIEQMSLESMEAGLVNGTLDLAITTYLPPISGRIVAQRIFTERLVLAVGSRHALYGGGRAALQDIAPLPMILRPANTPSRQLIERCFAARGCSPNVVMEMSSGEAILATVRCSELATICALRALDGTADLAPLHIDEPDLQRTGAILWDGSRYRSAAAGLLAEMVQRAYANDATTTTAL
jgi:LysR family transcriptional regulator, cyn operon transcriptional activator